MWTPWSWLSTTKKVPELELEMNKPVRLVLPGGKSANYLVTSMTFQQGGNLISATLESVQSWEDQNRIGEL